MAEQKVLELYIYFYRGSDLCRSDTGLVRSKLLTWNILIWEGKKEKREIFRSKRIEYNFIRKIYKFIDTIDIVNIVDIDIHIKTL